VLRGRGMRTRSNSLTISVTARKILHDAPRHHSVDGDQEWQLG
jgi:hypothetical protein